MFQNTGATIGVDQNTLGHFAQTQTLTHTSVVFMPSTVSLILRVHNGHCCSVTSLTSRDF